MPYKKLDTRIFGYVHVFIEQDIEQARIAMKKKLKLDFEEYELAIAETYNVGVDCVILLTHSVMDRDIVHESIHAAFNMLSVFGIKNEPDNHEALAYLADWIFEETKRFKDETVQTETK